MARHNEAGSEINMAIDMPNDEEQPPFSQTARECLEEAKGNLGRSSSDENMEESQRRRNDRPSVLRLNLVEGKNRINIALPLYKASVKGDWEAFQKIGGEREELLWSAITQNHDTPLHIAVLGKNNTHEGFVRNMVREMKAGDLLLKNKNDNTAFCLAAITGNVNMAKTMVEKNVNVLSTPGSRAMMPIYMAALNRNHDMVKYMYLKVKLNTWEFNDLVLFLVRCIENDMFDIARDVVRDHLGDVNGYTSDSEDHATRRMHLGLLFLTLARKSRAFFVTKPYCFWRIINSICRVKWGPLEKDSEALKLLKEIWTKIAEMPIKAIADIILGEHYPRNMETHQHPRQPVGTFSSKALYDAIEMGNTHFVAEFLRGHPDLLMTENGDKQSIFHIAVQHRQAGIYNLLYEVGSRKDLIACKRDVNGNTMLHLAGKIANKKPLRDVSGAALQMQQEVLWFREVEAMTPPSYRGKKNKVGLTAYELFTEEHRGLVAQGEKWMKGMASQCMVVAVLVAGIVCNVAVSIPGGYNQEKSSDGTFAAPLFYKEKAFKVFLQMVAISLVFSSSSVIIFLSILTSRYAERDFLKSLPRRLMFGLAALFISIATMLISLSCNFHLLYQGHMVWMPILISGFVAIPVVVFAFMQYHFLLDVVGTTFSSRRLFGIKKPMLYD